MELLFWNKVGSELPVVVVVFVSSFESSLNRLVVLLLPGRAKNILQALHSC